MAECFDTLELRSRLGVATIRLDRPPLNLFSPAMQRDLDRAFTEVERDPDTRVLILESAVPGYFVAHYDVEEILSEPDQLRTMVGPFNGLMVRIETSRLVTIAKVEGAARGGGCELALACDLRFAAAETAVFSFPEAALGILAAGGGTQRLPATIGRARALEMLLGCEDVSADRAAEFGLVNRSVAEAEIDSVVDRLSRRIAASPARAVALTKLAVGSATPPPEGPRLALEALALDLLKADPAVRRRIERFLVAGGQTWEGESRFSALIADLLDGE